MSQKQQGIDVSKEEEQYLRNAFRRFALPYLLVFGVVAWITTTAMSSGDAPSGAAVDVTALHEEITALQDSITTLDGRVAKVGEELEKAVGRLAALENRKPSRTQESSDTIALQRELRDGTKRLAEIERRQESSDSGALQRELREATKRLAELERRHTENATVAERIDALAARMQRIEAASASRLNLPTPQPAAPAPAAPDPAPAP